MLTPTSGVIKFIKVVDMIMVTLLCYLRLIYTGEFRIKLAHFNIFFITTRASLVQNRPRYRANVNDPLRP